MRPYVTVSKIPNFDPTKLPYWDIYEREGTAATVKVGGTMAGEFTGTLDFSHCIVHWIQLMETVRSLFRVLCLQLVLVVDSVSSCYLN